MALLPAWNAAHLPGSTLYFFVFMAIGSITPYLPVIWLSKGLSDNEVGLLAAVRHLSVLFVGPRICAFADKHSLQQKVLYGSILLFVISRSSILLAGGFLALVAVEASSCIFQSPIVNLIDSTVRNSFGSTGYGTQRLWGAAGYGLSTFASGFVYDNTTGGYGGVVIVFVAVSAAALVAALGVRFDGDRSSAGSQDGEELQSLDDIASDGGVAPGKIGPTSGSKSPSEADEEGGDGQKNSATHGLQDQGHDREEHGVLRAVWLMFSTRTNVSFFLAVALSGIGKGVIDTFLFIWLDDLGGSHLLLGLTGLVTCTAELPFFYLSGPLIRKIGPRNVVALAQIGYLLRFAYYSVLEDPWWVLPAEVLHGLTFAAMWAATTDYAHGIAPAHLRSTMQGTVSGLKRGLGYGLGAVLGGVLYSSLGPRMCFAVSAALPCLALLLLTVLPRTCVREGGRRDDGGGDELDGWELEISKGDASGHRGDPGNENTCEEEHDSRPESRQQ